MAKTDEPQRLRAARRSLNQAIACLDDLGMHQAAAHADLALAMLEGRWPDVGDSPSEPVDPPRDAPAAPGR